MPVMIHTVRRADLSEDGVLAFRVGGGRYVLANIDGTLSAYAVVGPAALDLGRSAIAEGRLRCPRHGWPIDPERGGCAAAERCRYEPLGLEADEEHIRVALPYP
jgi:nitrite reductase/ring-hydroxylating ferredoxin subunit